MVTFYCEYFIDNIKASIANHVDPCASSSDSSLFPDKLHRREEEDRPDGLVQQTYDGRSWGVSGAASPPTPAHCVSVFAHHILLHNEVLSLYNEVAKLRTYTTISNELSI